MLLNIAKNDQEHLLSLYDDMFPVVHKIYNSNLNL